MTIQERVAELGLIAGNHDAMLAFLTAIAERQQETLERLEELLQQVQRDSQQTHRLWVRLAERYGWLDDDDQDSR